ncbi:afadin- and alpha-actinin-binding protein [Thalassophryne amazonica]|uniref:afadin- and alpha-actinin-binding protein n=1 Tax=Thalassophryne amazonica TaxID=390379 RepID=UPI001471215E|nr:afadin- and alpha-actinin-binding protein [Thalassophryne amazonica]
MAPPSAAVRPRRWEEVLLRVMLERREAELREAMKLRHGLTTLLHALRVDMEQTLLGVETGGQDARAMSRLDHVEAELGDHVTGGVVQSWMKVQRKLQDVLSEAPPAGGTNHDKILAHLEQELSESQQLVKLQQQMLQDSLAPPILSELTDSYFLEEWERLQVSWAQLESQRRTFDSERRAFTEAAIRLSRERCDFEQQRACLLKRCYFCESPSTPKEGTQSLAVGE